MKREIVHLAMFQTKARIMARRRFQGHIPD
jgi:hypothetical protein